jgi:hypothetical protein
MSDYADNLRKSMSMALEAGLLPLLDEDCFQKTGTKNFGATKKVLERFFHLAAAAGAAAEREACARVCEALEEHKGHACAYAIRAREEK